MRKTLILSISIMFILAICSLIHSKQLPVQAIEDSIGLEQKLNNLIHSEPDLKGALTGISVRNAATGEILYSQMGETRLKPASNLKLFTAAAALSILGADYTFQTEILTDGEVKKNILSGNLYVRGKGDPTLLKANFDQMAKDIKSLGIIEIKGDLIGDDTWYDDVRYSRDMNWSDETYYYGAQISALTVSPDEDFDAGTVIVEVKPGTEIGKEPSIDLQPTTEYVEIINHAKTVGSDEEKTITIERIHGTNTIIVEGTIPEKAKSKKEWIAVWEPTHFALELFKQTLEENGIQVDGSQRFAATPMNASILKSYQSKPLSELLIPFMKLSNNVHGEVLVKEMGRVVKGEGSWEKGLEVLASELSELGVRTNTIELRDGSGISHINLVPPNEITSLLFAVQKERWFNHFLHSLPVSGAPERMIGGTLRNRMLNSPAQWQVRAKTGSIASVSSLSGYVDTKSGERLIFSIILNNLLNDAKGKLIEDKIALVLAEQ
ncbi:D-alanyl-D-alanine carboxypeptidase/D-alanyl-D-alanine-endopeptidase [Cytobacillus solani]|uniref:D-alanyl-D-alanine carboxypeptidase n=1 Tax=Cytobacillus solani TaxID=1637975 RepID=A0A0Q3VI03_9BACI|nr:D-alanyl-D-alanine carboxypeptidase/D-alanyl-D-alanine-endopeptidase [Cytobacillus solani]KOP82536.1 D-alanyl-D-alanine carboxypeptidase [Bacillus sp. FJAT-21945]KQL19547.1 D-alanyl-D-alanine carboxypeptidase [Cytobacillus solani]USK52773.1 D-alanyl-D-alanine carboxypeptidase/D-alanyl-D-alanine-endopeptidase [Cytobacillus solani]